MLSPEVVRKALLTKYRELEERGRSLAFRRDEIVSDEDIKFLKELDDAVYDLIRQRLIERGLPEKTDAALKLADRLATAAEFLKDRVKSECLNRKRRKDCRAETILDILDEVDAAYKELTGEERCTWLKGVMEPYTLSAAYNDITACYHRLVEMLSKVLGKFTRVGKCLIEEGAQEELRKACIAWDMATELLWHIPAYADYDYNALVAHVFDKKAEVRVGSAAGHMTHIDLEKGTLEYYDKDDNVNAVMKQKLEERGLKCELREGEGVRCEGVNAENVGKVFMTLAGATSMDLRLRRPAAYWPPEIRRRCEHLKTPEEREACMVNEALKMALKEALGEE